MGPRLARQHEVDRLIAAHGANAIGTLVGRISDAVRLCDDHAVRELDIMLQLIEARIEGPWRVPAKALLASEDALQR